MEHPIHQHGRTGLAKHASTAAFTTARTITSHVRRRYHTHYHGKYRFPYLVFSFDLMMLALATLLVGLNVYVFTVIPAPRDAFRLDFFAPSIRSAAPVALEARLTAIGEGPHEDVRLQWHLSDPRVEILEAQPPLSQNGSVYIGSMAPGATFSSRVVARIYLPIAPYEFGFQVADKVGSVSGRAFRQVTGSGLVFEPLLPVSSVWRDVPILYRVRNDTNLPLEAVTLRANGIVGGRVSMNRLEPFEERLILLRPPTDRENLVEAEVGAFTVVQRLEPYALLASDPTGVRLDLAPSDGKVLSLIAQADRPASLAIYHPGLSDADHMRILEIPTGRSDIRLPVTSVSGATTWYAVPFVRRTDGNALGSVVSASVGTPFTIHASGRYYAASGDQIGIGPLPPRVGETTKLWIGLRLGPTTSDLSDVRVRVKLSPGVRVTGRDALPDGGSFVQTDTELVWNLGYLPADADGASASFEIEITPTMSQKGKVPILVQSVTAEGMDARAQERRQAGDGVVDMNLKEDEIGKNRGTVD